MNIIFENWHQWKVCFLAGISKASWGIWRIVTCIILGIVSILNYVCKQIGAFCRRESLAAAIIGFVFFVMSVGWISTFMDGRVKVRNAEYQRDSMSIKLDKYLQAYESSATIIIDNDTIK
jgi:hypothetical protein